jgi:hypothetical protein
VMRSLTLKVAKTPNAPDSLPNPPLRAAGALC